MNEDFKQYLVGAGLVVGARACMGAFPVGPDVRFVDSSDLASLRASHPEWRALPLAPVDLSDPSGTLADIEDRSVNFVVDWSLFTDIDRSVERLVSAARVLLPGGALVVPICDSRFVDGDVEAEAVFAALDRLANRPPQLSEGSPSIRPRRPDRWQFTQFAKVIAAFMDDYASLFALEKVQRYGRFNVAVLKRQSDRPIAGRNIVDCDGHCYALHAPVVRHIATIGALDQLRTVSLPTITMSASELSLFLAGPPLNSSDVPAFLVQMDPAL